MLSNELWFLLMTIGLIVAGGCAYLFSVNPPLASVGIFIGMLVAFSAYHHI
jgi:hypothetical protein